MVVEAQTATTDMRRHLEYPTPAMGHIRWSEYVKHRTACGGWGVGKLMALPSPILRCLSRGRRTALRLAPGHTSGAAAPRAGGAAARGGRCISSPPLVVRLNRT